MNKIDYFSMILTFKVNGNQITKSLSVTSETCDLIVNREKQYILDHYNIPESMITVQRGLF